jgi:hypothetical protein
VSSSSFTMVCPEQVAEVGPAAAILFARILWRAERGGWRASRVMLAQETGLTPDTIRTACRVLRDRGWVSATRASADDATLVWRPVLAGQPDIGKSPTSSGGITHLPDVGESPISSYETEVDQEQPPSTPQIPAVEEQQEIPLLTVVAADAAPVGVAAEFDGFWAAYPRKVGKPKARLAYAAARKRASLEEIAAGLRAQLPDMRVREPGFIPHPTTWLNQDRWADDPGAAATRSGPRNYDLERMQARAAGEIPGQRTPATTLALQMMEGRP